MAGAAVHVAEPWKGYRQMSADEVIGRLAGASSEELAAVTLYERLHRLAGRSWMLPSAGYGERHQRLASPTDQGRAG